MDSLAFLERASGSPSLAVYVLHGDEDFLKRQALTALRERLLSGPDDLGYSTHAGDKATFATVHDELETLPFLSKRRLVVVDNADPFVSLHRAALEAYVAKPAATGTLVLDVKTWPANTRLAKLLAGKASIECKTPKGQALVGWCIQHAASRHEKSLSSEAARMLVELVGEHMGLLDQELAKLAAYVGEAKRIDKNDVDKLVGQSREEKTWIIFKAIGSGNSRDALALLARLFDQGEDPIRILGAFSKHLRQLAQAARLNAQGEPLGAALGQVGVPYFAVRESEQELRHLGRQRTNRLFDWLLETDLGLKGGSQLPPRTVLERLVVRLARNA